jgi:uncharacterized protein YfiM (DUF2279 family)
MMAALALGLSLAMSPAPQPRDAWLGSDKLKHFLLSAFVQSAAFSIARVMGANRTSAQIAGGASVAAVGLWKEFHDGSQNKPFSPRDLAWDAAGALTAAALLNGAR